MMSDKEPPKKKFRLYSYNEDDLMLAEADETSMCIETLFQCEHTDEASSRVVHLVCNCDSPVAPSFRRLLYEPWLQVSYEEAEVSSIVELLCLWSHTHNLRAMACDDKSVFVPISQAPKQMFACLDPEDVPNKPPTRYDRVLFGG